MIRFFEMKKITVLIELENNHICHLKSQNNKINVLLGIKLIKCLHGIKE